MIGILFYILFLDVDEGEKIGIVISLVFLTVYRGEIQG